MIMLSSEILKCINNKMQIKTKYLYFTYKKSGISERGIYYPLCVCFLEVCWLMVYVYQLYIFSEFNCL